MNKIGTEKQIKYYIAIIIGGAIAGLSFNMLLLPNGIAPAGISGLATVISRLTGFDVGVLVILLNIPLYVISGKRLGKDFILKSVVGTISMALAIDVIPMPAIVSGEPLLGAVFGGIMMGAGLGIAFRNTGSTGGTDILAKLLVYFFPSVSIGGCVMALDVLVITANGILGDNSAFVVLYSFICMLVCGVIIDILQNGVKSAKVYYIITSKGEEISKRINNELSRGATKIDVVGAYTDTQKTMLVCLILSSEAARLRSIIETDEKAFVYTVDAREVSGLGFERQDRRMLL